jgi:hypothetical protein
MYTILIVTAFVVLSLLGGLLAISGYVAGKEKEDIQKRLEEVSR